MQDFLVRHFDFDPYADGPGHATLLWAGVVLYLAVAGVLLHAIVVLTHSQHDTAADFHVARPQPVVVTIAQASAASRECRNVAALPAEMPPCAAAAGVRRTVVRAKHQVEVVMEAATIVTSNLLWAPPGSVLLANNEAGDSDLPPSAQVYALR